MSKRPPEAEEGRSPRFVSGLVHGWRAWKVVRGDLVSVSSEMIWPHYRRLEARHKPGDGLHDGHGPEAPCVGTLHCGIYAYKTPALLDLHGPSGNAWGEVKLWGRLVEHEYAFRAQFAYPGLVVCQNQLDAALVARNYGCDVLVDDRELRLAPRPVIQNTPVGPQPQLAAGSGGGNLGPAVGVGPPGPAGQAGFTKHVARRVNIWFTTGTSTFNYSGWDDDIAIARWFGMTVRQHLNDYPGQRQDGGSISIQIQ